MTPGVDANCSCGGGGCCHCDNDDDGYNGGVCGSAGCDSVDSSGNTYVGQMAIVRKCFLQYGRHPLTFPTFLNLAPRTILGL